MNTEFKGTKGKWRVDDSGYVSKGGGLCIMNGNECIAVIGDYNLHQPIKDNAQLIADAGNTIQQCNLLPSELLKQNKEMREMLEQVMYYKDEFLRALDYANNSADDYQFVFDNIEQFLTPKK